MSKKDFERRAQEIIEQFIDFCWLHDVESVDDKEFRTEVIHSVNTSYPGGADFSGEIKEISPGVMRLDFSIRKDPRTDTLGTREIIYTRKHMRMQFTHQTAPVKVA